MWSRLFSLRWCAAFGQSPFLAALLAMLLAAPALDIGLVGDDLVHQRLLAPPGHPATSPDARPHPGAPFGLFTFVDGQPAHVAALQAEGRVAWWAAPDLRLSFWRPLSELTHWLDARLWPDTPWLMHLHSLLWYGLFVTLLLRLYRAIDPDPVRNGLAVLLFAISSLHLFTVAWIAARNQLVAGCFSLITVLAFHRWRQSGGLQHGLVALSALVAGLLSAEAAVGTVGYLVAHVLAFPRPGRPGTAATGQRGSWPWARSLALTLARTLWPFLLVVVLWRTAYSHLGYGSTGSGAYIDPGATPLRFAQALLLRLPTLLMAGLTGATSSVLQQLQPAQQALYAAIATSVVGLCVAAARTMGLWSTPVPPIGALARFYGLGTLLSLIPVCAAESNDRLLLNVEVGLSGLLALLFTQAVLRHGQRRAGGWVARAAMAWVALLAAVHLAVFPVLTLASATLMKRAMRPTTVDEPLSIPLDAARPDVHVLLLNPPAALFVYYYPDIRAHFGLPNAASAQALANGDQALTLTVEDAFSFTLTGDPVAGKGFPDAMSRDTVTRPFHVGDTVDIGSAQVTVLALTPDGAPRSARFRFSQPLGDAHWRFLFFGEAGYEPLTMPAPGQSITLKKVDLARLVGKAIKGG